MTNTERIIEALISSGWTYEAAVSHLDGEHGIGCGEDCTNATREALAQDDERRIIQQLREIKSAIDAHSDN